MTESDAFRAAERRFWRIVDDVLESGFPPLHGLGAPQLPNRRVGQLTLGPGDSAIGVDLVHDGGDVQVSVETLVDDHEEGPDDQEERAREDLEDLLEDRGEDPSAAEDAPRLVLRLDVDGKSVEFIGAGDDAAWCAVAQSPLADGRTLQIAVRASGVAPAACALTRVTSLDGYRS